MSSSAPSSPPMEPMSPSQQAWASSSGMSPSRTDTQSILSPPPAYLDDQEESGPRAEGHDNGVQTDYQYTGSSRPTPPPQPQEIYRDPQSVELLAQLQERAWQRHQQQQQQSTSRQPSQRDERTIRPRPRNRRRRTDESDRDSVDSLNDGASASGSESDYSDYTGSTTSSFIREQEAQLKEALDQLELALKVVLCPLIGKWMGRRWAYWGEQTLMNRCGSEGLPHVNRVVLHTPSVRSQLSNAIMRTVDSVCASLVSPGSQKPRYPHGLPYLHCL